jgi:hypothetical protein
VETLRNWGIDFVCFGYIEGTSVGNTKCSSSICLHCSAYVSALLIMLSDSLCVFSWSFNDENSHIIRCIKEWWFLRLCWHTRIMGRQHHRRGTVGANQHWQKGIVIYWGLFQKSYRTTAAQVNCSRTEYSSWRMRFHKNCLMWASQFQHTQ